MKIWFITFFKSAGGLATFILSFIASFAFWRLSPLGSVQTHWLVLFTGLFIFAIWLAIQQFIINVENEQKHKNEIESLKENELNNKTAIVVNYNSVSCILLAECDLQLSVNQLVALHSFKNGFEDFLGLGVIIRIQHSNQIQISIMLDSVNDFLSLTENYLKFNQILIEPKINYSYLHTLRQSNYNNGYRAATMPEPVKIE